MYGHNVKADFDACDKLRIGLRYDLTRTTFKVCTGIYGAKVLTNGKKIFQLSCALKKLFFNKVFFALIRSVLFEKLLMRISQQQVRPPFWHKSTSSRPLLSRNLSQNTSFSIDFGYSWLRLSQRFKNPTTFFDVNNSRKQVVGLIYTKQFMS